MDPQSLLEFMVKALVDHPDQVNISETQGEIVTVIEVRVADEDTGRVIGREGRIVNALRTVAKAAGAKDKKKVTVEIISREKEEEKR